MTLSWKKIGAYCGILGGILFVIITFVIMLIYPGGYSFLENSFSSLGLTETNGQPTMLNYILFSTACTSAAVCSVPFWLAIRTVFEESGRLKMLGWLGLILGFIAAVKLGNLNLMDMFK